MDRWMDRGRDRWGFRRPAHRCMRHPNPNHQVYDDQHDYFNANSAWLSEKERHKTAALDTQVQSDLSE